MRKRHLPLVVAVVVFGALLLLNGRAESQTPATAGPHNVRFTDAQPRPAPASAASARRALRRDGRLAITLRLTVTPSSGVPYTATRSVVLRPA